MIREALVTGRTELLGSRSYVWRSVGGERKGAHRRVRRLERFAIVVVSGEESESTKQSALKSRTSSGHSKTDFVRKAPTKSRVASDSKKPGAVGTGNTIGSRLALAFDF